jgi:hypothetical protein
MEHHPFAVGEPSLAEVLSDPVVKMMMHYDGVEEADVRQLSTRRPSQKWRDGLVSHRKVEAA